MLARKYDNYAWQQQQVGQEQQPRRAPRHQGDNRVALGRAILTAVIVLATYMFVVWRSEAVVLSGQQLLQLERQDASSEANCFSIYKPPIHLRKARSLFLLHKAKLKGAA